MFRQQQSGRSKRPGHKYLHLDVSLMLVRDNPAGRSTFTDSNITGESGGSITPIEDAVCGCRGYGFAWAVGFGGVRTLDLVGCCSSLKQ